MCETLENGDAEKAREARVPRAKLSAASFAFESVSVDAVFEKKLFRTKPRSPQSISRSERILKGPRVARADTFASLSAVAPALQSAELAQILTIFRDDRYLIAYTRAGARF